MGDQKSGVQGFNQIPNFITLQKFPHSDSPVLCKSKGENSLLTCCELDSHPWEQFEVEGKWRPRQLRCLIVGENPSDQGQPYFYQEPQSYDNDPVTVRRALLGNLSKQGILESATLTGFREAGFLFDHAIRCHLPKDEVAKERERAQRYQSERVQNPVHLLSTTMEAPIVWVMGHLASNAIANLTANFPKKRRRISHPPFPGEVAPGSRYFLSEYLRRWNTDKWPEICAAFCEFTRARGVF